MLTLAGLGVGGAYGVWQWAEAQQLLRDTELWDKNEVQAPADVDGEVTTRKLIFNSYKLKVTFADESGFDHTYPLEFDTLWSTVEQSAATSVRYARGRPEQFALSWAMDVKGGRWAAFIFMFGIGVFLLGGGVLVFGVLTHLRTRQVQAAAKSGVEIECDIVSVTPQIVNGRASGNDVYRYKVPEHVGAPPGFEQTEIVTPKKGLPLLLDGGKKLVAIVSPQAPKNPVVVRADLWPLAFDDMTRMNIQEQAARRI